MINGKRILVVVTARKGSKGIAGKNYKELLGKPLFMWSVLASLNSKYVDHTVVSSNCEEVEKITQEYICKTMFSPLFAHNKIPFFIQRPDEISGDTSKNEEALIHVLENVEENYDVIINLQPTSPIRSSELLDKCIEEYYNGDYDSLLTAIKITPFIWQKINGKWKYTVDKNDCCNRKMRQEFNQEEFVWHDCGSVFITDVKVMLETGCRIGKKLCVFPVEGMNSLQIDEEFDFELIEKMAEAKGLRSLV